MITVQISPLGERTGQFTPLVLEHHLYSLISSGENSACTHFAAAIANHYNLACFVPPGTHFCWVDRGSRE